MKKIKLLAPFVGSLTALTATIPAVSCSFKEQLKYFKVQVNSSSFKLTNQNDVQENDSFKTDITWGEEGFTVDTSKIRISVGNKLLNKNDDYSYRNDSKNKNLGHLEIFEGIINDNVTISLSLIEADKAPITLLNISQETMGISLNPSTDKATINSNLELTISWKEPVEIEDPIYYANLISVYVGSRQIGQKSLTEPDGFTLTNMTASSINMNLPAANIKDNSEIYVLVDLEQSAFDTGVAVNNFHNHYIRYLMTSDWYDAITSPGDPQIGDWNSMLSVSQGETVEFVIDLDKWETGGEGQAERDLDNTLYFTIGQWNKNTGRITFQDLTKGRAGRLWYGQEALEYEIDEMSNTAIVIHAPSGGWGEKGHRSAITGWYTFPSRMSLIQILIGQVTQAN